MRKYKTLKRSKVLPQLLEFVERHNKFKSSYFWTPPAKADNRRNMEENNQLEITFILNGVTYTLEQSVRCSCRNVYYRASIQRDGDTKTISTVKKLIKIYS